MGNQAKSLSEFRRIRIVEDPSMHGQRTAKMYKDDDEVRVSPAMYRLLKTDFDSMAKNLRVIELPRREKDPKK